MAGSVLSSSSVLRLNFCAKLNICASISATSPSCKPLCAILSKLSLLKEKLKNKSKLWALIFLTITVVGAVTPFIDYFVVIQMFYLLIPFGIILIFSALTFVINLIKFKKNVFKQNLTLYALIIPIFLTSQIISTFFIDKIQRFRSEKIISKLEENQSEYPKTLNSNFGIKYMKLKNENTFELEYNRGFFVREVYQSKDKKWESFGWND